MKRLNLRGTSKYLDGYTLIEVMIFLVISAGLLLSASVLISGRQQRTQFNQSVVKLDQELQDYFNDVSTGYYPARDDFECRSQFDSYEGHTVPVLYPGSVDLGENSGCTFVGKLISMPVWTDRLGSGTKIKDKYWVHTMVSTRDIDILNYNCVRLVGGTEAGDPPNPGIREEKNLGSGIEIMKVVVSGSTLNPTRNGEQLGGVAIVSDFSGETGPNDAKTGNSARLKLYGYGRGTGSYNTPPRSSTDDLVPKSRFFILNDGHITVCILQDGASNGRKAALIIDPNLSIQRQVDQWPAECN